MADISKEELRKEITAILKDADLTALSAKKVRQQIEEKLEIDLSERKKEVDDLVMECLQDKRDGGKKKKKAASEESEEGEEEEEEGSEEEEEEEKKPAKRGAPAKKPVSNKRKKGSSDDEESASDEDASDEEYSPQKNKSPPKKAAKPAKKGKKKASDSDSDEDWSKNKKGGGGGGGAAKKGAGKGKGGYTRAITLSPELAAVVGAEQMARHEVVKKVWSIIKERNLYDPKNKQFAICDDELMKVIGVKRFRTFGMMKYLKNHFVD